MNRAHLRDEAGSRRSAQHEKTTHRQTYQNQRLKRVTCAYLRDGAGRRRSALHELTRCRVLQVADDTKMLPHSTHHEELQWTEEEGMWKEEKENEEEEADALALALYRRAKVIER